MNAYWIAPSGGVVKVDSRHIHSIIEYPETFGMSKAAIEKIYRRHHEHLGAEGNAREEIMIRLMERGWMRLRYVPQRYSVTVQLSDIFYKNESWKKPLTGSLNRLGKEVPEKASVVVMDLGGGSLWPEQQVYEIASGSLFERRKTGTFAAYLNPRESRLKKRKIK